MWRGNDRGEWKMCIYTDVWRRNDRGEWKMYTHMVMCKRNDKQMSARLFDVEWKRGAEWLLGMWRCRWRMC